MSGFNAAWLTLREPEDARARAARLTRVVTEALPGDRPAAIVDLAAGTGSNVRYLSPFLRTPADWLIVDHDPGLLSVARERLGDRVEARAADLADVAAHAALVAGRDLVTASALLDLVSETWLRSMLTACASARASVLFALNYDGRIECSPAEPDDEYVRTLVNRHQRTDKGFGPALGPEAAGAAAAVLLELGYEVVVERSDWTTGPDAVEFQLQLIDGWASSAAEAVSLAADAAPPWPAPAGRISAWRAARMAHVESGRSRLVVGHEDVAGLSMA